MDKKTKVITVSLNPSLDRTLVTHFMTLGYHNRTVETSRLDPAGRGIGIARALHSLGVSTHALLLLGDDATGHAYQALLAEEQFPVSIVYHEGHTSSKVIIKDTGHESETILFGDATSINPAMLQPIADLLSQLITKGDTVVFAGSLPDGVPLDTYARLTEVAQAAGAQVILNAGGGAMLLESLKANPDLVYLTQLQAEGLFNYPVRVYEDMVHCAQQLREQGAKAVLIAMSHANTILLVTEDDVWTADRPDAIAGTYSGQAEAMIAGYLAGRLNQHTREGSLELGSAAVVYTVSQDGHEFGTLKEVNEFIEDVNVTSAGDEEE